MAAIHARHGARAVCLAAGQAPQQPEQAIGLGAAGLRQLLHRPPSGCQLVGHAQLGGHVDHLGHPGAAGQLEQLVGEAEGRGAEGAEAMELAEAALIPRSAGTPACHTLGLAAAPFETLKTITSFCGRAGESPLPTTAPTWITFASCFRKTMGRSRSRCCRSFSRRPSVPAGSKPSSRGG